MTARAWWADSHHIAVVEDVPSGFGPTVWVGELRTLDDKPVTAWLGEGCAVTELPQRHAHRVLPVTVGATEHEVLFRLQARARAIGARA